MAGSGGAGTAPREHRLQPGDTLAGLALRYGVTMEQIQRANRLYSSDTIFLKATLLIPAAPGPFPRHRDPPGDLPGDLPGDVPGPSRHDLSASDFLRRLDAEIGRSKEAAAQRLQSQDTSTEDIGDIRNGTPGMVRRPSPCHIGDTGDTWDVTPRTPGHDIRDTRGVTLRTLAMENWGHQRCDIEDIEDTRNLVLGTPRM
ncbi:hypothetical protein DUI87_32865 [Hirundo rustica rustica]|uniref:LysM and putative peptidoglycan-binding domain-containing protein 1 n=1 Tax=Hirundo rustica rustica TaxID=333673 RepID=A0A3M0IMM3_HIRRU|nr:hypothetical protein DUI87_32865 [Hirundo rustica rustica]